MHYTCIACITIDSVMKMDKKNLSASLFIRMQIKGKKKIQMSRFINAELELDSESDSHAESKSDTGLITKLKSSSDSDSE